MPSARPAPKAPACRCKTPSPPVVPWSQVGAIAAGCLVTAVVSSVLPAALLVRRRAADLAGARE